MARVRLTKMGQSMEVKPWRVEYAKSGRALCRTCRKFIHADKLRLGKMARSSRFDGFVAMWSHADCIMNKLKRIKSTTDVEGLELLRWEDQQKIKRYVDRSMNKNKKADPELEIAIEVSPTSRATCRHCREKIMEGEVRISTKPDDPRVIVVAWHHASCFLSSSPSVNAETLYGWGSLPDSDQEEVLAMVKRTSSARTGEEDLPDKDEEPFQESTSKAGLKRMKENCGGQMSKLVKFERDVSTSKATSSKHSGHLKNPNHPWSMKEFEDGRK